VLFRSFLFRQINLNRWNLDALFGQEDRDTAGIRRNGGSPEFHL
jgi:hypothetical protein